MIYALGALSAVLAVLLVIVGRALILAEDDRVVLDRKTIDDLISKGAAQERMHVEFVEFLMNNPKYLPLAVRPSEFNRPVINYALQREVEAAQARRDQQDADIDLLEGPF